MFLYDFMHEYMSVYAYIYIYMYIYICVCVCVCVCASEHIYVCTHVYAFVR